MAQTRISEAIDTILKEFICREEERKRSLQQSSVLHSMHEQAGADRDELRDSNTRLQAALAELESQKARLAEQLSQAQQESEKQLAEVSQLQEQNSRLQTEVAASTSRLEAIESENARLTQRASVAEQESSSRHEELSRLQEQNSRLQAEVTGSKDRSSGLEADISRLSEQLLLAEQESLEYRETKIELEQRIHTMQTDQESEVQGRTARLTARIQDLNDRLSTQNDIHLKSMRTMKAQFDSEAKDKRQAQVDRDHERALRKSLEKKLKESKAAHQELFADYVELVNEREAGTHTGYKRKRREDPASTQNSSKQHRLTTEHSSPRNFSGESAQGNTTTATTMSNGFRQTNSATNASHQSSRSTDRVAQPSEAARTISNGYSQRSYQDRERPAAVPYTGAPQDPIQAPRTPQRGRGFTPAPNSLWAPRSAVNAAGERAATSAARPQSSRPAQHNPAINNRRRSATSSERGYGSYLPPQSESSRTPERTAPRPGRTDNRHRVVFLDSPPPATPTQHHTRGGRGRGR